MIVVLGDFFALVWHARLLKLILWNVEDDFDTPTIWRLLAGLFSILIDDAVN